MSVYALNCQRATEQKPEIKFDFRIKVQYNGEEK